MKLVDFAISRPGLRMAVVAGAALVQFGPSTSLAAPVEYTFTTAGGPGPYGNPQTAVDSAIATLGSSAVVSGSFLYDSGSPLTATLSNGFSIYGGGSSVPASFSSLAGTVAGYNFSDPRGYVAVGHDVTLGTLTNADSIEIDADPETVSGIHNFNGFALGPYSVVDMRMLWNSGQPALSGGFLTNQNLPGTPPPMSGVLALDLNVSTNPTYISTSWVFFNNLMVQAAPVPEPANFALMLGGLGLLGLAARRRISR